MKFALNLKLQTIQILTSDVEMLILCLSYSITTYCTNPRIRKCFRHSFSSFALLQVQEHCLIANETFELQINTHHYQLPCRDLPLKYLALFH